MHKPLAGFAVTMPAPTKNAEDDMRMIVHPDEPKKILAVVRGVELANLFAASDDLLAALKALLPMWESGINEPWIDAARAAIAKAEGGAS